MNIALLISVAVVGSLSLGSVLMILGLKNAPDGHEDENGFHYGQPVDAMVPVATHNDFATCLDEEMAYAGR
jgi:hypothetical protein